MENEDKKNDKTETSDESYEDGSFSSEEESSCENTSSIETWGTDEEVFFEKCAFAIEKTEKK